jgi:hypothetical protein
VKHIVASVLSLHSALPSRIILTHEKRLDPMASSRANE